MALPLIFAVTWSLFSLDRLATQSERLVFAGRAAAENNRLLAEHVGSFERISRLYVLLRDPESLPLMRQDVATIESRLDQMSELTEIANASTLARSIGANARSILSALEKDGLSAGEAQVAVAKFDPLRDQVSLLTRILSTYVDEELRALQESTRRAQEISGWQVAALIPGTLVLVLFFTLLVARPIRQIDDAISQLGQSGFSKPISIKGPTDLEKLGPAARVAADTPARTRAGKKSLPAAHVS